MNESDAVKLTTGLCSKCSISPRRISLGKCRQRLCLTCHAAYIKEWRKAHKLTDAQKVKANARSYAKVYQKRGKLIPKPCEVCGEKAQKHHDDYSKPLEVRWFCARHHQRHHREMAA